MKNKKGFTLVELISILTILGILALITIPVMNNVISKTKNKALKEQKATIVSAARKYSTEIAEYLPKYDGDIYSIEVSELRNTAYLEDENIIDPTTNKPMKGCVNIIFNASKGKYNYEYTDECKTYASTPELDDKMIPIVYRNNRWETVGNTKWYDYDNKEWANAVIVKDYTKYKDLDAGVEVLEDDIVAYFVWIPRYSYTIQTKNEAGETTYGYNSTDIANPGAIDIKFVDKKTTDNGVANYSGNEPSNYRTSDAFWHDYDNDGIKEDNEQVSGIWIGKFENGVVANSECAINPGSNTCDKIHDASSIVVKSNQSILRHIRVGNHYSTTVNFGKYYNIDNETRMIKTADWGSVLYLAQSIYGRCENKNACLKIGRNNKENFITGGGDYKSNLNQSTTGNITGMYDVHGGAWEVTMSFYQAIPVNSAIPSDIEPKDYEIFTSTHVNTACNGNICYGYALSETLNWFQSSNAMINASHPTLTFGGSHYQDGGSGFRFYESQLQMSNNSSRILIQTK